MSGKRNILVQISNISEDDLHFIEKDLSFQEKASIAFLLFGDNKANAEVMLQKLLVSFLNKDNVSDLLIHFSTQRPDWKVFLVEALAIVRANKVIRKLGLKLSDVKNYFLPHIKETSLHINPILKVLYFICDQLTPIQATELVLKVEENLNSGNHLRFYSFEYLEVFFLNWIAQGKLDVSDSHKINVSLLALYFKHNSMNNFLDMLSHVAKSIISPIHDPTENTAKHRNINENNLVLDKMRISEDWSEYKEIDVKKMQTPALCDRPAVKARRNNEYEISREVAGFVLIINQRTFYPSQDPDLKDLLPEKPLTYRKGTDYDRDRLSKTFSAHGYTPIIMEDLDHIEILRQIGEVVYRSIVNHSVIICILSHGEDGCVFGSDSIPVKISEIRNILTNKELEYKPKMLIIQACQGEVIQKRQENIEYDGESKPFGNHFDMIIANSTIPGYASLRDTKSGSWYIQTLCDKIDELGDEEDIMGILTAVNEAIDKKKNNQNVRMTPILESTLRKKFRLPSRLVS